MPKRIKSNSGKDIRDILYTNENITIYFDNDDDFDTFMDYCGYQLSYFGFVSIEDVLCYFNMDHDFINSKDYGWGFDTLYDGHISTTNIDNRTAYTLPIAEYFDKVCARYYGD